MKKNYGILLTILAAFIFGFTPVLAKITYAGGSNATNLTFFRAFFALPILYVIAKKRGADLKLTKEQFKHILIVAIFGQLLTTLTLYASYDYMSIGMATNIHFIYPALVILVGIIMYKEKVTIYKLLSLGLAIGGILFFLEPGGQMSTLGFFLTFLSGITYAFYMLYIDKSGLKSMDSYQLSFYLSAVVSTCMLGYGMLSGHLTLKLTPMAWGLTVIISVLVTVIAVVFLQMGIKSIGSTKAAVLTLIEPVTSVIGGFLILGESLTSLKVIGCVLIVLSGLAITRDKEPQELEETKDKELECEEKLKLQKT